MFGYIITTLAAVFWTSRVLITLLVSLGVEFMIVPMNMTFEIVLLFITFACIVLIARRKMLGAVIYLIAQCSYFGVDAYKTLETVINGQAITENYVTLAISLIGILIPIFSIMGIGLSSGKKTSLRNKKTDWFYATTEYDRKFDDRADKNQYKF